MNKVGVAALLTSGRTLKQGRGMELGKMSKEYFDEVSVCEMDSTSLKVLGISEGDTVLVESNYGEVIVKSRLDKRAEPGVVFIPCGPYANMVTGSDTEESGMPNFKNIPVVVYSAKGAKVLTVKQLLKEAIEGN